MTSPGLLERPLVHTGADLAELCRELRAAGRFALDTEFAGERTYVPRLCLVQVATDRFIALIDALALPDLSPLWELLVDPAIEKVLHAAREDLRLAYYGGRRAVPAGIFDTQVAAGLVGLPQYPLGYGRLVEAVMGVRLDKGETRSDWDRRPLTPEQIRYARDDVRYLLPIAGKLQRLLSALGRDAWAEEEMRRFAEPLLYEPDPDRVYLRLRPPRGGLPARATARLRALAAWRERESAALDVPVRSLLRDEALTDLALRPPQRLSDLAGRRVLAPGDEVTLGPGILHALSVAHSLPETDLPPPLPSGTDEATPPQRVLADFLYACGCALCLEQKIAPELALTRSDALALVRGGETALTTGWRRTVLGDSLQRLAQGKIQARVRLMPEGLQVMMED